VKRPESIARKEAFEARPRDFLENFPFAEPLAIGRRKSSDWINFRIALVVQVRTQPHAAGRLPVQRHVSRRLRAYADCPFALLHLATTYLRLSMQQAAVLTGDFGQMVEISRSEAHHNRKRQNATGRQLSRLPRTPCPRNRPGRGCPFAASGRPRHRWSIGRSDAVAISLGRIGFFASCRHSRIFFEGADRFRDSSVPPYPRLDCLGDWLRRPLTEAAAPLRLCPFWSWGDSATSRISSS